MKPDAKYCKFCGKEIVGRRGKEFCSDAHRKAFERNPDKSTIIADINADKPNPDTINADTFRKSLSAADRTFYDRVVFPETTDGPAVTGKDYYYFNEIPAAERRCMRESCKKKFTTTMSLLKYCSYDHYSLTIGGK